jgi:hypothetical protein
MYTISFCTKKMAIMCSEWTIFFGKNNMCSDSTRHQSQDLYPPISQIVLKNLIQNSLIIKECPEEI